jgi:hypothetical protein
MAGTEIRLGFVRVSSTDPPLSVTCRLAEERPDLTSGWGGWEEVPRPRRSPITTWKGSPGNHLTLPVLLDAWAAGSSIERDVSILDQMGRPVAADGNPPRLTVTARGNAVPGQARRWVIDTVTWGDALMNANGDRVRQYATLELLEYVDDVYLQDRAAANARRAKAKVPVKAKGAAKKRVVAKKAKKPVAKKKALGIGTNRATITANEWGSGESLVDIAANELGDGNRWIEIAELNGLRDPRAIQPGQVIRLP